MNIKNTLEKIRPLADCFLGKSMSVLDKTWGEILVIKRAWNICSLLFKISYILYLIYALCAEVGNLYLNIIFLLFSLSYMLADAVLKIGKSAEYTIDKSTVKRRFRIGKILIDTVKLSMAIYGVVVSWNNPSVIGVVLAVFSALIFIFDVAFEIVYTIIISRYALIREAFDQDITKLKATFNSGKELVGAVATVGGLIMKPGARTAIAGVSYASRYIASKIDKRKGEQKKRADNRTIKKLEKIHTEWCADRAEKRAIKKEKRLKSKLDKKLKKQEAASQKHSKADS